MKIILQLHTYQVEYFDNMKVGKFASRLTINPPPMINLNLSLDQVEFAIRSTSSNWAMEISIVPPAVPSVHPNINSGASSQGVADTIYHADKFKLIHVAWCVALCTSRARVDSSVYLHLQPHISTEARYIPTKPDPNSLKT